MWRRRHGDLAGHRPTATMTGVLWWVQRDRWGWDLVAAHGIGLPMTRRWGLRLTVLDIHQRHRRRRVLVL